MSATHIGEVIKTLAVDENRNGVTTLSEYFEYIKRIENDTINRKIMFRGESRHYIEYCTPNVFRGESEKNSIFEEYKLYNRIKSYRHVLEEVPYLHIAIDAQHGGLKSRLLDLTENALIALYFAVEENIGEHGYVYVFSSDEILDTAACETKAAFERMIKNDANGDDFSYRDIYILGHSKINDRITRQQGLFALYTSSKPKDFHDYCSFRIKINSDSKISIKHELERFFGITKYYVYPEIMNLSETIESEKNFYKTFGELKENVNG